MLGFIALYIGRKVSLWAACVLYVIADVVMMVDTSIGGLYAARLVIGLANGIFMTFSQLYLQVLDFFSILHGIVLTSYSKECAPAKYRGLMISSFQTWTSLGIFRTSQSHLLF